MPVANMTIPAAVLWCVVFWMCFVWAVTEAVS
jgi:hypothetical protein